MHFKHKRKLKAQFIKWRMHRFFPNSVFGTGILFHMNQLSKWAESVRGNLISDDFFKLIPEHHKRYTFYEKIVERYKLNSIPINYIEFGVGHGKSMKWWLRHQHSPESKFFGFDSFGGLPSQWGSYDKGHFDRDGLIPDISDERLTWKIGLFEDSFKQPIEINTGNINFFHVDCDLYSSTAQALSYIEPMIKQGDFILFDEFGVPLHEFKAFYESPLRSHLQPQMAFNNYLQVLCRYKKSS